MAFDFKTTPAVGDVFEDSVSGAAYKWSGTKWWRTKAASRPNPKPPPPIITRLTPNQAIVGDPSPVLVTVTGGIYTTASVVQVNGATVPSSFVSASELTFNYTIPAGPAVAQITVINPDGQVSAASPFNVIPRHELLSIAPDNVVAGAASPVTITATGTGFTAASVVSVDNNPVATTFVSATSLTFPYVIPSTSVTAQVRVTTAGQTTPPLPLTVVAAPLLTSIDPAFGAPSSAITITATGANFTSAAGYETVLYQDGVALPTTVISSTRCSAVLVTSATPTTDQITVKNGSIVSPSAAKVFEWVYGPRLFSMTPTTGVMANGQVEVTLTGDYYGVTAGQVTLVFQDGAAVTTTLLSATQCRGALPPNVGPGPANITVKNGLNIPSPDPDQIFTWT